MIKSSVISCSCKRPGRGRRAFWLALPLCLPVPAAADVVYQWTDATGLTHFSDSAPPVAGRNPRTVATPPGPKHGAEGLRPGERARLHEIERRQAHRQRDVLQARQRVADAAADQRSDCRERHARQRATGNHPRRKAETTYLRRHCW